MNILKFKFFESQNWQIVNPDLDEEKIKYYDISEEEIDFLKSELKPIGFTIVDSYWYEKAIHVRIKNPEVTTLHTFIRKMEDDYFLVESNLEYAKCDQIEGVVEYLKDRSYEILYCDFREDLGVSLITQLKFDARQYSFKRIESFLKQIDPKIIRIHYTDEISSDDESDTINYYLIIKKIIRIAERNHTFNEDNINLDKFVKQIPSDTIIDFLHKDEKLLYEKRLSKLKKKA